MAEASTEAGTTRGKRGRPAGAKTTASSGNANRRTHKPSLSGRMGALERKIAQQGALLQRIARGIS